MERQVELRLISKKRATSAVWAHFGIEVDENDKTINANEVTCRICKKKVAVKDGSTTNMTAHLKIKHPREYSTTVKQQPSKSASTSSQMQTTIAQAFSRGQKYPRDGNRWKELTDSVAYFLAKEMLPFYTVEKEGFKRMLTTFDRQYDLPGRKYFSNTAIPELYNKVRSQVASSLQKVEFFSATIDMWSSNTMTPFMSLTAHFINENGNLKAVAFKLFSFPRTTPRRPLPRH